LAALVCVDAGTSRTRAWLVEGGEVRARAERAVGARDTAREGHDRALRAGLREVIAEVLRGAGPEVPRGIAAAGMITSRQGLVEVPHVAAPAGLAELAAATREERLPDVAGVPFLFVPGVRSPADVMRGEETLGLGLLARGRLAPGEALLNAGSHWKLVLTDGAGRIAGSVTSLSGELMRAAREETILASAVPDGPSAAVDVALLGEGMEEARRGGLARALFRVRLLELEEVTRPAGRLSFLIGAFVGADLEGLRSTGALPADVAIAVAGDEPLGGAWTVALESAGLRARAIPPAEVEAGLVAGLVAIVEARTR